MVAKIKDGYKYISRTAGRYIKSPSSVWLWLLFAVVGLVAFKKVKNWVVSEINLFRIKTETDGTTKPVTVNTKEIARNCYHAIYGGFLRLFEDEEAFVKSLLQCPKDFIPEVATEYAKIDGKGKNLFEDAREYLSDKQYNEIRHLFLSDD